MALPKIILVREDPDNDGTTYLVAEKNVEAAVRDEGVTVVGTYQLVSTRRITKAVKVLSEKRAR